VIGEYLQREYIKKAFAGIILMFVAAISSTFLTGFI
jgi:hypothetical protein